jgi:hypothetical protein
VFHRRAARHAATSVPAPERVPVVFPRLEPGHLQQRPYAHILLGVAPFRIGDVVRVTTHCRFAAHVGRTGTVVCLGGTHKLILVEFDGADGAGIVYFEAHELELVRNAPTVKMPVVTDPVATVPVSVVQVPGATIGYWSPGWNAILDTLTDTATLDAVDDEAYEAYGPFVSAAEVVEPPEPTREEKLQYAATCAASGNPLCPWERELLGLDADDAPLMGGAHR